jgi:GTPase
VPRRAPATPARQEAPARPEGPALPKVAILGRPNVGKSTLFNVLLGRRRAITFSDPGVTRDPVEVQCRLAGARVLLIDTGGYVSSAEEPTKARAGSAQARARAEQVNVAGIDRIVSARSLQTAREADLVLLVLDAAETTAEDEDFLRRVRPFSEKIFLVVNKVDTPDRDALVWNAHAHGFPNVFGVSAAHGRGIARLKEMIAGALEARLEAPLTTGAGRRAAAVEPVEVVRIAILGKPNTGKSSLANRLTGTEKSIVSPIAGTTRDIVENSFSFRGKTYEILDTAGIRRKSRVKDPVEYYSVNRAFESIGMADLVFLLVDATEGLVDQDKKIAAQAIKEGRGVILVLSKWDLLSDSPRLLKDAAEKVRFQFPILHFAPIAPVSAVTGYGVRSLLDTAAEVWDQLHRRVGTGRLNQALEGWLTHYRLPVKGHYKIRFMTQVSANPVRFVAFVNRMSGFPVSYTQYLENCIRRDLGVPLVPVSIELRQSTKSGR